MMRGIEGYDFIARTVRYVGCARLKRADKGVVLTGRCLTQSSAPRPRVCVVERRSLPNGISRQPVATCAMSDEEDGLLSRLPRLSRYSLRVLGNDLNGWRIYTTYVSAPAT